MDLKTKKQKKKKKKQKNIRTTKTKNKKTDIFISKNHIYNYISVMQHSQVTSI